MHQYTKAFTQQISLWPVDLDRKVGICPAEGVTLSGVNSVTETVQGWKSGDTRIFFSGAEGASSKTTNLSGKRTERRIITTMIIKFF